MKHYEAFQITAICAFVLMLFTLLIGDELLQHTYAAVAVLFFIVSLLFRMGEGK